MKRTTAGRSLSDRAGESPVSVKRVKQEHEPAPRTNDEQTKLSADGQLVYDICQEKAKGGYYGATQEQIQALLPHLTDTAFGQLINDLLDAEWIEVKHMQTQDRRVPTLVFCPIDEKDQSLKASLTNEERVCYDLIKDSGNLGIWVKDVIRSSNLHRQVVSKCISKLEIRKLIKGVKPVKNPTKKVYMLYETDPSTDVTGGAWYTDQELDQEYVAQITRFALHWIKANTAPQAQVLGDRRRLVTATQVQIALEESAISQMPLSEADVNTLLLMCVYDGKLERLPGVPPQYRIAARATNASSITKSSAGEQSDVLDMLQAGLITESITSSPCGVCPVYKRCTEGAIINPQECLYFDAWTKGDMQYGILTDTLH